MSDVSNRTIVALLAVALVVSVAGTMYSVSELGQMSFDFRTIAGAAEYGEGNLTLNLSGTVAIAVHQRNDAFIQGNVISGEDHCAFSTGGDSSGSDSFDNGANMSQANAGCGGDFADANTRSKLFHLIENTGNVKVNVSAAILNVRSGGNVIGHTGCSFLTGINETDGTNGCNNGSHFTDSNVDVSFGIDFMPAFDSTNNKHDNIPTTVDVDDTAVSYAASTYVSDLPEQGAKGYQLSQHVINDLAYENNRDEAVAGFEYVIPADAIPGVRTVYIEYSAIDNE